jgi:hypothetical protein
MTTTLLTIPPLVRPATDEEVAGAYAAAYASADVEALLEILAPDVVSRLLMPTDFRTLTGNEAFVEELATAVAQVDGWRPHSWSVAPIGDRFATRSRLVLEAGGGRYQLEHQEVVTVRNGKVVAIDGVCSGFRPVTTDRSAVGR